jgi:hypothetical protein
LYFKKIAEALDAKLLIKFEPKDPMGKYILAVKDKKPLVIGEAKKRYGNRNRS